jgi:four helix bundle protein
LGRVLLILQKKVLQTPITIPLTTQLVKAGTSVGANYCEADCTESKKDFVHKLGIRRKEAKEAKHWLRMIVKAIPNLREEAQSRLKEANELNLIFSSIIRKTDKRKTKSK